MNEAARNLYLFNPENDLALAAGIERYTPPRAAVAMSRCGQLLPMWMAEGSDYVLVGDEEALRQAEELRHRYGLKAAAVKQAPPDTTGCEPWGWSLAARRRFLDAGVDSLQLPSDEWLSVHRRLSSRLTTVALCNNLDIEAPVAALTVERAIKAIEHNLSRGHDSFMKMPWSCSGRGVFTTERMNSDMIRHRADDIIRAQGCVMIEPDRHRARDFAALYRIEDGEARFHALSLFDTDATGSYRGNLVISDDEIASRLGIDPMKDVERMAGALTAIIGPHYSGWAGVDMVTTADGSVWPCIELNLRATMGVVAAAMRPFFTRPMLLAPSPVLANPYIPIPS